MATPGSSTTLLNPRPLRQASCTSSRTASLEATMDGTPKEGPRQEPPPAYTPPVRTRLQESIAVALLASNPALADRLRSVQLPSTTATLRASSIPDPDEEPLEELSPINLRISARVNVARDNNIIAVRCTPAEQARSIAESVVAALKSGSVANGGIPMIDQDGRPRPVRIEVDAGITVEGANNVVGTEAAVMDIMRARHAVLRQRMAGVGEPAVAVGRRGSVATAAKDEPSAKRRRH